MKHQPYVYICFAREDRAAAEVVCRALEGAGIRCWMAPRDILPGVEWAASINQAIEDCFGVIPIISSHFNQARHAQDELFRAQNAGKVIIPLRIENVLPVGVLRSLLATLQSVDAFNPPLEPKLAPLIRCVTQILEPPNAPRGGFELSAPGDLPSWTLASAPMPAAPMPASPPPSSGSSSFQPGQWLRHALEKLAPTRRAPAQPNPPIATAAPSVATPAATIPDASLQTSASPHMPEDRIDRVHFSVSAPRSVQRGAAFVVAIWAHLGHQHKELLERIRETSAPGTALVGSKGPVQVSRGVVLSVLLHIDGMSIPFPSDTILWEGEIGNASFPVTAPPDAGEGSHPGTATLYINQIQIARIHFVLEVGSHAHQSEETPHSIRFFHSGFASYASPDRDEVLGRIQGMQKIAPDLNIFLDVASLRSGADWEKRLSHAISKSDVFYLFWSAAAKASPWVEREWRCALTTKGFDFIDPVPLVSPDEVAPPEELSGKHFNDWILAFRRSTPAKNRPPAN